MTKSYIKRQLNKWLIKEAALDEFSSFIDSLIKWEAKEGFCHMWEVAQRVGQASFEYKLSRRKIIKERINYYEEKLNDIK